MGILFILSFDQIEVQYTYSSSRPFSRPLASSMQVRPVVKRRTFPPFSRQRPYHVENTSSRPITEVKQRWARLVLGWETAWEHRVLLSFAFGLCGESGSSDILLWRERLFRYNPAANGHTFILSFDQIEVQYTYSSSRPFSRPLASSMQVRPVVKRRTFPPFSRQRPYHVENTSSRPITEVKQRWARLVLGWETAWEHRVLLSFAFGLCGESGSSDILLWRERLFRYNPAANGHTFHTFI